MTLKVFVSYAHEDDAHRQALERHLSALRREGLVELWNDRRLDGGDDWAGHIAARLAEADVVLLLVSADFLASDYCNDVEVAEALQRHRAGLTRVIPVILSTCDWQSTRLGVLNAWPRDGRSITEAAFPNQLFGEVAESLRRLSTTHSGGHGPAGASGAQPPARPRDLRRAAAVVGAVMVAFVVCVVATQVHVQTVLEAARDDMRMERYDLALDGNIARLPSLLAVWPGVDVVRSAAELGREGMRAGVDQARLQQRLDALLLAHPHEATLHYLQARGAFERADLPGATQAATAALLADPLHAATHALLGLIADVQGDPTSAEGSHRRAADLKPAVPQYATNLARAVLDQGRHEEAAVLYQTVTGYALASAERALAQWALGELHDALQSQLLALKQLATAPAEPARPRVAWQFAFADPRQPGRMRSISVAPADQPCLLGMELAVTRVLLEVASQWELPAGCAQGGGGALLIDVLDADVCRYLVLTDGVSSAHARELRRAWAREAPCLRLGARAGAPLATNR